MAQFAPVTNGTYVGNYFVKSTNDPYLIPVGFDGFSDADRTITFTVKSRTASAGTQYVAPSPVTVKAGQVLDTLRFKALFSGYPSGRKDTVVIKMSGYPTVNNIDSFTVVIQPYCDVILDNLVGLYNNTYDVEPTPVYGPYVSQVVLTNNYHQGTTDTIRINNFADYGGYILVRLDWTDPANFKATVLDGQNTLGLNYPPYGIVLTRSSGLVGTFSSCDQTFDIKYNLYVSAGSFGNFRTKLSR